MPNLPKIDIVKELKEIFKEGFIKSLRSNDKGNQKLILQKPLLSQPWIDKEK